MSVCVLYPQHARATALSRSDCVFRCHVCSPVSLCSLPAGAGCGLRVPQARAPPATHQHQFTVVSFTRAPIHSSGHELQIGVDNALWTAIISAETLRYT